MTPSATNWQLVPLTALESVAADWDRLNTLRIPLLDSAFVRLLRDYFAQGDEKILLGRDSAGMLVHAAVVRRDRWFSWTLWQPSQEPIALWVGQGLSLEERARLLSSLPGVGILMGITQLDSALSPMPPEDPSLQVTPYITTARLHLAESFEKYWEGRGKNLRQNYRRQKNLFERERVDARLEVLASDRGVAEGVESYAILESQGWKAESGTALQPGNVQAGFYTGLLRHYAQANEAAVFRYWYNEKIVAVDLCLCRDRIMYLLKTTYDESQKKTSPALHMRYSVLERFYASGEVQTIEFYGRVMEWHLRWTDDVRQLYHATVYRSPKAKALVQWFKALRSSKSATPPAEAAADTAADTKGSMGDDATRGAE